MARINGVEIRGLKRFIGTEGYAFQGNIYIDGKKQGFWSQDANGGVTDWFDFDTELLKSRIPLRIKEDTSLGTAGLNLEVFMDELILLKDDEKQFKKSQKKGFNIVVALNGPLNGYYFSYRDRFDKKDEEKKIAEIKKQHLHLFECVNSIDQIKHRVFYCLNDFNIKEKTK